MYGKDNLAIAYNRQYKDKQSPLFTYKHRNKPYGVSNRFERNMLEFIDVISNDLPSYKKTKKAMVKAAKHSLRFQTKRQMERELIQDYDDTRQLMWWDDQYKRDEYDWWLTFYRNDHYAFPGPSLGYYSDRVEGRQAYVSGAFEDARYDEVYDYRNGYDYDYISRWKDDLYAELGLNDKL